MGRLSDLTGQKINRWTVIERVEDYISPKGHHIPQWLCQCECGNYRKVLSNTLKSGTSKSCGCLQKEIVSEICKENRKQNQYDLSGEYGIGYTSKGEEFYFDLEDYDKIKDYCWYIRDDGYVGCTRLNKSKLFHRMLHPESEQVDHINHKRHDNRKCNLRLCNNALNQRNRSIMSNNTSGVTGVYFDKRKNSWISRININGKQIYLGSFKNFDDAVKIRKEAEEKYFGYWSYDNSINII